MMQGSSNWVRRIFALALGFILASGLGCHLQAEAEEVEKQAEPEKAGPAAADARPDLSDPKTISGTPPEFPLKSSRFDTIDDSYEHHADNFDHSRNEMEMPFGAMEDIMLAIRASTHEHLVKNIDEEAKFRKLMKTPEQFRGHVVKLIGVLADTQGGPRNRDFLHEGYPATLNLSGFERVYKGQTTNANGEIISFRSMEPVPADMKPGQSVQLIGIFMMRYCYLNRDAGKMLTWTPMVFVRRVVPYTQMKEFSSTDNPMSNTAVIVVFLFVGGGAAAYFYSRMKYKTRSANRFTRMKEEKEQGQGAQGFFPRPPPSKKPAVKKKPVEKKSESTPATPSSPEPEQKKDDSPPASSGEQSAPA